MIHSEGFLEEVQKTANTKQIAKILGGAGLGALAGGGAAYAYGEKKRKSHLKQLANLFRQANMAENKMIARRAFAAGKQS